MHYSGHYVLTYNRACKPCLLCMKAIPHSPCGAFAILLSLHSSSSNSNQSTIYSFCLSPSANTDHVTVDTVRWWTYSVRGNRLHSMIHEHKWWQVLAGHTFLLGFTCSGDLEHFFDWWYVLCSVPRWIQVQNQVPISIHRTCKKMIDRHVIKICTASLF